MRRAFTLLELMMVVGLMAFLGLASANGYHALRRGIVERSAVESVSAFLRAAKERALVDRVPTAVFYWNRCVQEASLEEDKRAIVVGEMVAVRRAGRITKVDGSWLYDEFSDLERAYDAEDDRDELKKRKGFFRLWQIPDSGQIEMKYSTVSDGVLRENVSGVSFMPIADGTLDTPTNNNVLAFAFFRKSDYGNPVWNAGTAYGLEFQRLTLPEGFIFGSSIPKSVGEIGGDGAMCFKPDDSGSSKNVDVAAMLPGSDGNLKLDHVSGKASSQELKE